MGESTDAENWSSTAGQSDLEPKSTPPASPQDDPNTIDWNGPDDSGHPLNWSWGKRIGHVVIVSSITLVVNLASTLFAPAAGKLAIEFDITNTVVQSLIVSLYLLGFALGPLFIAPLSELYGRLWIYHTCNICFLAFTIGCATSQSIGAFLACRFLAGCAGSAPLTIGGGTIADVTPIEKRGSAMAAFGLGPILGPVLGPVVGGFVAASLGWRWTLWLVTIVSGVATLICFLLMRETFAPVLLARRVARMRKETGNSLLRPKGYTQTPPTTLFLRATVRPTKMLLMSPIVIGLSIFNAFLFGLIYLLFTTFPVVFHEQYGWGTSISGLSYLGMGIGMLLGLAIFSVLSDRILKWKQKGGESKPEYRLPVMMWFSPLIPTGFFWYGWSAEYQVQWIVPILGTSLIGMGSLFLVLPSQIYLVDAFGPQGAASALAGLSVLRSFAGCFLPLAGRPLYDSLGFGWGNSLLGFIGVGFLPVPWLFYRYGEFLRTKFAVHL